MGSAPEPRRRGHDWGVELREPSQWNPISTATPIVVSEPIDGRPVEIVWPETQPCCHD